jgi:uncharacterized lipoprotein YmbA
MEKNNLFYLVAITTALLLFAIGGCVGKSPPTHFYRLTSITESQDDLPKKPIPDIAVGIGPVIIADYIDQAKIVTRSSENKIERAEFDQWSGSFKNNFTEVLADNLGDLLRSERIFIYPWRSYIAIDYQVLIDVIRCDGQRGKNIVLAVRWSVLKGEEKRLVAMKRTSITQAVDSTGHAALVAAYSRALGDLSIEIAERIQAEGGK